MPVPDSISTGLLALMPLEVHALLTGALVEAWLVGTQHGQWGHSPPAHPESPAVPAPNDLVALLKLGREVAAFQRTLMADSYTAEPGAAVRDEVEHNPGKYKIVFRSLEGEETCYRGLSPHTPPAQSSSPHASEPWGTLQDPAADPNVRLNALDDLIGSPREAAAVAFLAEQLARPDLTADWRDAVVFAVEAVHLPPELRADVADRLLAIAADLRTQPEGRDKVVWSALRRGASLIPPEQAERLLPFLQPGGSVDTRSVALQCIARVFELGPPDAVPVALADRAAAFAEKFLDQDVFAAGESSLIVQNAVAALAAMGDSRLSDIIVLVKAQARPWLTRRVGDDLARLRQVWQVRNVRPNHPAMQNLNAGAAKLG